MNPTDKVNQNLFEVTHTVNTFICSCNNDEMIEGAGTLTVVDNQVNLHLI